MRNTRLLMVLHSQTLPTALSEDSEVVHVLLECARIKESLVLATPVENESGDLISDREDIHVISYHDREEGLVIRYETEDEETGVFCGKTRMLPSMITHLYGCAEGTPQFSEILNSFRDLIAFESIANGDSEAIFVTQDDRLIEKRIWIQSRFRVKILSFLQALEYFDLFLKKNNLYYANPYTRRIDGKAFHYWFLLKELVPNFGNAWSTAVFGKDVIPNGHQIQDFLSALADRFQNAMCAADRIAMEYVIYPVNSTEWEMIYNLNYFVMLVTGIFDSLAWLTVNRYSLNIRDRTDVTIRIIGPTSKGARFARLVSRHNPSLSSFIQAQQDFINLFYPMRDSIQHREPVRGAQFVKQPDGWIISTAQLKQDALSAIQAVDRTGSPFTEWGVLVDVSGLLEPHRFSRKASRRLITFVDRYLELLDFNSSIASHDDVMRKIAQARSSQPEPPFIAKTYLKRDSHLPILFRPRHRYY